MDDVFIARDQLTDWSLSYMSIEKIFEKKSKFVKKKFFFAKFCLGDHSLIEESDLPGLVVLYLNSKNGSPQHLNIVRKNFLSC